MHRNCANMLPGLRVSKGTRRRAGHELGPESSWPEISLALRLSMIAGSPCPTLGCQEAKRSAEPSASPLWRYPLRT